MITQKEFDSKKITIELIETLLVEATKDFGADAVKSILVDTSFDTVVVELKDSDNRIEVSINGDNPLGIINDIVSGVYRYEVA